MMPNRMSRTIALAIPALAAALASTLPARSALAGEFDARGNFRPDPSATAFVDFAAPFDVDADYFEPLGNPMACNRSSKVVAAADALSGGVVLQINVKGYGCADRFVIRGVPATKTSYRATLWMRHGSLDAQLTALYRVESGLPTSYAKLAPTGRTTSDGWVELASNELPVDGAALDKLYLKLADRDAVGTEVDAVEVVAAGAYVEERACAGASDPVCGPEAVCRFGRCELGRLHVPPLPDPAIRDQVVDRMRGLLVTFFGGRKTRLLDLPRALERLDSIRTETRAWPFWNGFATAIRELHDWHTHASGDLEYAGSARRLDACFIAGDGDASAAAWPKHPTFDDVLVSHVGDTASGLRQGDRLVAIDGQHPIAWALALKEVDWGYWQASDDRVVTEFFERLRELIPTYAATLTFLACNAATGTCDPTPKTLAVSALDDDGNLACDNRPFYYLEGKNPGANHDVGYAFFEGKVKGTSDDEKIRALIWDTLYGGGDPDGVVNGTLKKVYASWKASARGVLLDHRAGNGGTLDGAETATTLMRAPATALVFRSPIASSGFEGPADAAEGLALFAASKNLTPFRVGSASHDPALPVAILLHRDGSASDFFPYGVKGASSKVRLFGPSRTAGAFSTFFTFTPPGPISFQIATGDSIGADGAALIGQGVEPDEIVKTRQSDLLAGRDTLLEAALAWLRKELKP